MVMSHKQEASKLKDILIKRMTESKASEQGQSVRGPQSSSPVHKKGLERCLSKVVMCSQHTLDCSSSSGCRLTVTQQSELTLGTAKQAPLRYQYSRRPDGSQRTCPKDLIW
jgi:hypothetical protein